MRVAPNTANGFNATERLTPAESAPVIAIAAPRDSAVVNGDGLRLSWRAIGSEARYRVAVQDSAGGIVWSTATDDTSAVLPPDVALAKGGYFYWSVSAQIADGRSVKSGMHRFMVR